MLEIEFVDRSVALAGKAFVSFFPLVIVVAAFVPERIRSSIITTLTHRLGIRGDALALTQDAFASSDDVRKATGVLGLVLTIFFATLVHDRAAARLPPRVAATAPRAEPARTGAGSSWLLAGPASTWRSSAGCASALGDGLGLGLFAIVALAVTSALWWFTAWFLLLGRRAGAGARSDRRDHRHRDRRCSPHRPRSGCPTWSPTTKRSSASSASPSRLVTWFSGAAICILVGACAGPVFAEDTGGSARSSAAARTRRSTAGAARRSHHRRASSRFATRSRAPRTVTSSDRRSDAPGGTTSHVQTTDLTDEPTDSGPTTSRDEPGVPPPGPEHRRSGRGASSGSWSRPIIVRHRARRRSARSSLPMTFAAVLAIVFKPLVGTLERHKLKPTLAAGLIVLGLLALMARRRGRDRPRRDRTGRPDQRRRPTRRSTRPPTRPTRSASTRTSLDDGAQGHRGRGAR